MFFSRLKEERKRLAMNQSDLAGLAGASKRTLGDWERGFSSPTGVQLCKLFLAGVDVIYVLTGARMPLNKTEKLTAMMRVTREVEPDGGPLTELALAAVAVESGAVADERAHYNTKREQALLANFRASSESGKQALETAALVMAEKAGK